MDIGTSLRELGPVDTAALSNAILCQVQSAWGEDQYRQQAFEVHKDTESLVLIFVSLEAWPEIEIRKEPGWDRLADAAIPVMHDIIDRFYPKGGTIIRAMAAKLLPGGKIRPHIDTHPSFHCGHRIHVPITTNSRVRLMVDGRPHRLEVGKAYELNNQMSHSVMNKGTEDRITFIFDYIPPEQLARLGKTSKRRQAAGA